MEGWERRARHIGDMATILPVMTILLFMPPLILVFATPRTVFDVPLIVIYLYFVWALVILVNFVVVRKMTRAGKESGEKPDGS